MKKVAPHHITQARHYQQQGLTQKEIGRKIGLSKSSVTRILAGGYRISGDSAIPVPVFPSDGTRYDGRRGARSPEQITFGMDGLNSLGSMPVEELEQAAIQPVEEEPTVKSLGQPQSVPVALVADKLTNLIKALTELTQVIQQISGTGGKA